MKPSRDNTFCWYPFTQLALKQWAQGKGIVSAAPCCNSIRPDTPDPLNVNWKLKKGDESITAKQIFEGKEMDDIRLAMLNGQRHPACKTCWDVEDRSTENRLTSYREYSTPSYNTQEEDLINDPKLRVIDFAFGEDCNLRCRICTPGLSNKLRIDYKYFRENNIDMSGVSSWDWKRIDADKDKNLTERSEYSVYNWHNGNQWRDILENIHDLRQIKATGGETLITKPFNEFLDHAIATGACKNIVLEFHSNCTKFTNTMIEKVNKFKKLYINGSIDSYGRNYEYMRFPMPWNKLTSSIEKLLQRVEIPLSMSFNPVITALNAYDIPKLFEYQQQLSRQYKTDNISFNMWIDLLWPENKYISVQYLPRHLKEELIEIYEDLYKKHNNDWDVAGMQCSQIIDFLRDKLDIPQARENMLKEVQAFDKSRNQLYNDYIHPNVARFLDG